MAITKRKINKTDDERTEAQLLRLDDQVLGALAAYVKNADELALDTGAAVAIADGTDRLVVRQLRAASAPQLLSAGREKLESLVEAGEWERIAAMYLAAKSYLAGYSE